MCCKYRWLCCLPCTSFLGEFVALEILTQNYAIILSTGLIPDDAGKLSVACHHPELVLTVSFYSLPATFHTSHAELISILTVDDARFLFFCKGDPPGLHLD